MLQEDEVSVNMFTSREAVSQQQLPEEMFKSHNTLVEMRPHWTELDDALLAMTNNVNSAQDGEIPTNTWKEAASWLWKILYQADTRHCKQCDK